MGTDDLFKKRKGIKKKRKESTRQLIPYRYLIVCEGKKTEPNYFTGIKRKIDTIFKDKVDVRNSKIDLDIQGTGRNSENLVNYALKIKSLSGIPYGHVWVVFDRDDYSDEQFNNAIIKATDNGIKVAWSNEAIELWFLLHFEYLDAAIHRHQYIDKLNEYFRLHNVNGGKYEKNLPDIFDILCQAGSVQDAIHRSRKLYEFHCDQGNDTHCCKNPCNTVFSLVEELIEYIE